MLFCLMSILHGCTDDKLFHANNTPPTVTITSPADGDVFDHGDLIEFRAEINDPEQSPDSLDIIWSSSVEGSPV